MNRIDEIVGVVYRKDVSTLGRLSAADANLSDVDGRTPLMHAVLAEDADPAVAQLLVDRGARVDAADRGGWTALHFAARDQHESLVRLLLEAGAEVDPVDSVGNTPLWRSVMNSTEGCLPVMKVLLDHGADPDRSNQHGVSPRALARDSGQADVLAVFDGRDGRKG